MQLTISTTFGAGCWTMIVADVNCRSVMFSVQLLLGQSGAPGTGVVGGLVVTLKEALPFLISEAGIASGVAATETGAGFCPGGLFCPERLVHVAIGLAVAVMPTTMSWKPSPASVPVAVSVSPLSMKNGPALTCTLLAPACPPINARLTESTNIETFLHEPSINFCLRRLGDIISPNWRPISSNISLNRWYNYA